MPQTVEIIGVGTVEFPDDMTPDEIKGVLKSKPPTFQAPTPQTGEVAPPVVTQSVPERPSAVAQEAPEAVRGVLPESLAKPARAIGETATEFVKGIPQMAKFIAPPTREDVVQGALGTYSQMKIASDAEPFSQEWWNAVVPLASQYAMQVAGVRTAARAAPTLKETLTGERVAPPVQERVAPTTGSTLTETLFGKQEAPLVDQVNAELDKLGVQDASKITSDEVVGVRSEGGEVGTQTSYGQQRPAAQAREGTPAGAQAAQDAVVSLEQEPAAQTGAAGTGDRFVLDAHGRVFDTVYHQSVTPSATSPEVAQGALKSLNESDLNGKFVNSVTFAADPEGNPILVSDGLPEPIKVSPSKTISGAGAEPTTKGGEGQAAPVGRTVGSIPATGEPTSVPSAPVSTTAKTSTQEIPVPEGEIGATASGIQKPPPTEPPVTPTEPVPPQKPSKIGQSIEAKAVEAKLTQGFAETAGYDPLTIADQSQRATDLIKSSVPKARAIIRGDAPLPEGLRGTSLITAMEEQLLRKPDAQVAYELANSPLTSATSAAAQEMRLMAERVPDGIAAKFTDIKRARSEGAKLRGETPEKINADITKEIVKQSSKRPTWEQFVREIIC